MRDCETTTISTAPEIEWISPKNLADRLNLQTATISFWRREGRISPQNVRQLGPKTYQYRWPSVMADLHSSPTQKHDEQ